MFHKILDFVFRISEQEEELDVHQGFTDAVEYPFPEDHEALDPWLSGYY